MRSKRFGLTTLWILLGVMLCSGLVRAEEEMRPARSRRALELHRRQRFARAGRYGRLGRRIVESPDHDRRPHLGRRRRTRRSSDRHVDRSPRRKHRTCVPHARRRQRCSCASPTAPIAVHVHSLERNETVQIETPNTTVMLREPGEYAIDTEDDGDRTIVKTRSGEAEVTGPDSNQHGYIVGANEQGVFTGSDDLSSVMTQAAPPHRRSKRGRTSAKRAPSNRWPRTTCRRVRSVIRISIRYGTWNSDPEYGNVWQPSTSYVFTDWAPYRYGRWIWVTPWGWTWVDDAPWGFAPFHYGRWTYLRQRWCWVPGPRHLRPMYAPALVAWVGPPSFGVHFREVGWFPLGPREIYIPARRSSWRYFHSVNAWNSMDTWRCRMHTTAAHALQLSQPQRTARSDGGRSRCVRVGAAHPRPTRERRCGRSAALARSTPRADDRAESPTAGSARGRRRERPRLIWIVRRSPRVINP